MTLPISTLSRAAFAAALALPLLAAHAQDVAAGKAAFAQCAACHSIDGSNGAGPSLKGIVGSKAGTFAAFASAAR
jgi:cytochrome c